jgi:Tol biopolymer transport system component
VSKDGGFLAFRSTATDLVPGVTNGLGAIFLYDRTNNVLLLASASRLGNGAADNWCLAPAFSDDGTVLVFGSWASDLAPSDFNGSADLFLLSLYSNSVIPLFSLQFGAGSPGQSPTIFWPVMSGKTYRVQFKDNLADPVWQDLPSGPTIIGNQGYINDPTAPSPQRFYRVLAF